MADASSGYAVCVHYRKPYTPCPWVGWPGRGYVAVCSEPDLGWGFEEACAHVDEHGGAVFYVNGRTAHQVYP